jgi:hypothetical protein
MLQVYASQLLNKEQEDEDPIAIGCDPNNSVGASATDDDSSTTAGTKNIFIIISLQIAIYNTGSTFVKMI